MIYSLTINICYFNITSMFIIIYLWFILLINCSVYLLLYTYIFITDSNENRQKKNKNLKKIQIRNLKKILII